MKPKLPEICNKYSIREPTFHLYVIRHAFVKQLIKWHLLGFLNTETGALLISCKLYTHALDDNYIYGTK